MRRHSNRSSLLINAWSAVSEALLTHERVWERKRERERSCSFSHQAFYASFHKDALTCCMFAHSPSQTSSWCLSSCQYMRRKNINTPDETTYCTCGWKETPRFMTRHISELEGVMFIPAWLGDLVSRCHILSPGRDVSGSLAQAEFYMRWHRANLIICCKGVLFRACWVFWQQMRLALRQCHLNHKWHWSVWIRFGGESDATDGNTKLCAGQYSGLPQSVARKAHVWSCWRLCTLKKKNLNKLINKIGILESDWSDVVIHFP